MLTVIKVLLLHLWYGDCFPFIIGNDLFVELTGKDQLLVFDIVGWNLKYSLRKASNESTVWDVHKDFVLSKT